VAGRVHAAVLGSGGPGRRSSRATGSNEPMVVSADETEGDLDRAQVTYYRIRKAVTAALRYTFEHRFTSIEDLASGLRMRCSVERLEEFFRHDCPHMGEHRFILVEEGGDVLVRAIPSKSQRRHRPMDRGNDL